MSKLSALLIIISLLVVPFLSVHSTYAQDDSASIQAGFQRSMANFTSIVGGSNCQTDPEYFDLTGGNSHFEFRMWNQMISEKEYNAVPPKGASNEAWKEYDAETALLESQRVFDTVAVGYGTTVDQLRSGVSAVLAHINLPTVKSICYQFEDGPAVYGVVAVCTPGWKAKVELGMFSCERPY